MKKNRYKQYDMFGGRAASSQPAVDDDVYPSSVSSSSSSSSSSTDACTPLHTAVQNGEQEVVRLLLTTLREGDINQRRASDGATALWIAVQNNDVEMANLLLTAPGVDVDKGISVKGHSPLRLAVQTQHISMVALLLRNNADPDLMATDGSSPLRIAITENFTQLQCMLTIHRKSKSEPTKPATFIFTPPDTLFNDKRHRTHMEPLPNELTGVGVYRSRQEILSILAKHSRERICPALRKNIDHLIKWIQADNVDSCKALAEIARLPDAVNILNSLYQFYGAIKAQGLSPFMILMIASQPDGADKLYQEAHGGVTLREMDKLPIPVSEAASSSGESAFSYSASRYTMYSPASDTIEEVETNAASSSCSEPASSSSADLYTSYPTAPDATIEEAESYADDSSWTPFGWDNLSLG